ncbi:hypothetical protein PHYSODRAFT_320883 [Phytophthora sojae]|uniref:Uncharacterized protein n=1 Tax=Phytophthora sojae (strain P6497) TaxID=1094619 RepID=G4YGR6_PHYSP|nr:hypothetical protein PHYSODRAFT_320883 [Phytophthora sojae]EGZ27025.1 hypothetical protein PHYSODRAFT_320883 [Phytophthora sojae]|eukprot:XP_009514300.1 hypothetical protein PHYSODRAFT_320883 [Phytophthora sojae]
MCPHVLFVHVHLLAALSKTHEHAPASVVYLLAQLAAPVAEVGRVGKTSTGRARTVLALSIVVTASALVPVVPTGFPATLIASRVGEPFVVSQHYASANLTPEARDVCSGVFNTLSHEAVTTIDNASTVPCAACGGLSHSAYFCNRRCQLCKQVHDAGRCVFMSLRERRQ